MDEKLIVAFTALPAPKPIFYYGQDFRVSLAVYFVQDMTDGTKSSYGNYKLCSPVL